MATKIPKGGLYNQNNPPPSIPEALDRRSKVLETIDMINGQLVQKNLNDFPNQDAYTRWKDNAVRAAAHYRTEAGYLRHWLRVGRQNGSKLSEKEYAERLTQHHKDVELATQRLREKFQPLYAETNPPRDCATASARLIILGPLLIEVEKSAKRLRWMDSAKDIGERTLKVIREPHTLVWQQVRAEMQFLERFVGIHGVEPLKPEEKIHALLAFIAGLVRDKRLIMLRPEENTYLETLR